MEEKKERLNKYLAACGICSRREADRIIEMGKVTVDGEIASMGMQVTGQEEIAVHGKKVFGKNDKVVLAYYKPAGVTCTEKDRHAERKISDELKYPVRLTYAGRLDKDSTGLILMTNDGDLIEAMMKGSHRHEKEYIVTVKQEITPEFLESMAQGVYLKDLHIKTRKCRIRKLEGKMFSVVLTQGVNRQIKRMCKACGNTVSSIKRVRIMNIELGDLPENAWREIQGEEKRKLYELSGQKRTDERADR